MEKLTFSFVLYGNIIYSKTKDELEIKENSFLVCKENKVEGIFDQLPNKYYDLQLIDCKDKIIIPGMIDMHIHAPQFAFRGIGMDYELIDWLNKKAFKEESKYSNLEYARKAYEIFSDSIKKSATTRAVIFSSKHVSSTILLMELMEKSGIISYVGKVNMDREAPNDLKEKDAKTSIDDTIDWLNEIKNKFERTYPIITPRFIPSCSNELLMRLGKIREEYDLPVQSHLSENMDEIKWVKKLRPDASFYGDAYDIYGLFGNKDKTIKNVKTIMAHCVWSEEEEIKRIKENGVFIAHCPSSNLNIASGIAPIRKYLDEEIQIGLGSDVAGGQSESIFEIIVNSIQVSKMYWRYVNNNYKPLTFEEAFYLATKSGGRFFGKVGSFEEGYEFDALVLDDSILNHPQELSLHERLERAIYLSLDKFGIIYKFVNGKKVL